MIDLRTALIALLAAGSSRVCWGATTREQALSAFHEAAAVLQHPRCLNCHPAADHPTQGDDLHTHIMAVQRGQDDHGAPGMRCGTCHGAANYAPAEVPGAPKWGLAPRSMAWQGLSEGQICEALKDPAKNHGKTLDQIVKHSAEDPLVGWAWQPGSHRAPAPGTQAAFGALMRTWADGGAPCEPTVR